MNRFKKVVKTIIQKIKYFQTVVRYNSFSVAAEKCFISQSAISQQIQSLERELGVKLLYRTNRKFSLTPAGEYFYRKSLFLISDFEAIVKETVQIANGNNFTLRIGYIKGYGGSEFQKAIVEFTKKYPDIRIDMKTGNHEDLYNLLRTDHVDLVLNDQRRAFSDEYFNVILKTIGCNIEISSSNSVAPLECVNVDDLHKIPCILVSSKEQQKNEQRYYREIYGINSDFLFAESLDEARIMVIGAKGFLPIEGGELPIQYSETIIRRPLCRKGKPIHRNYCAFWKVDNSGYYIEEFVDILKTQFN